MILSLARLGPIKPKWITSLAYSTCEHWPTENPNVGVIRYVAYPRDSGHFGWANG